MSTTELFQRQPDNEIDESTGTPVVGFGFGLRDAATRAPLPEGDPSLVQRGVQVVDLIALDQFPYAMADPSFDPGQTLELVPDHNQGGAVGVWDRTRQVQVGWLPGLAATDVNESLAQGRSQHAVSLWARRTADNRRTGLRVAISTEVLPIEGHIPSPHAAEAQPPPPFTQTTPQEEWSPVEQAGEAPQARGILWALVGVLLAVVIVVALWFAFFRGGGESEPPTTTPIESTTTREETTTSTAPPTSDTTLPPSTLPPAPPTAPPPS